MDILIAVHSDGKDLRYEPKCTGGIIAAVKTVRISVRIGYRRVDLVCKICDYQIMIRIDHDQRTGPSLMSYGAGGRFGTEVPGPVIISFPPPSKTPVRIIYGFRRGKQIHYIAGEEAMIPITSA